MNPTFDSVVKSRTLDIDFRNAGIISESLNALCTDLFLIVMNITPNVDMGTENDIRRILKYYVNQFDLNCTTLKIDGKKKDYTKYALVALIDEKILKLPEKWSAPWRSHMLQLDYFGDMVAGERFFEHLDLLLKNPGYYYDVIEIYYLCLCLGFKGRYLNKPKELQELIARLPKIILTERPKTNPPPVSYARQDEPRLRMVPHVPTWIIASIAAAIILAAWIGINITVNSLSRKQLPDQKTIEVKETSPIDDFSAKEFQQ